MTAVQIPSVVVVLLGEVVVMTLLVVAVTGIVVRQEPHLVLLWVVVVVVVRLEMVPTQSVWRLMARRMLQLTRCMTHHALAILTHSGSARVVSTGECVSIAPSLG